MVDVSQIAAMPYSYMPAYALDTALRLRTARAADWDAIRALLGARGLSSTGLRSYLVTTLILERGAPGSDRGDLIGCVALEPGEPALVRSLAVTSEGLDCGYDGVLLQSALRIAGQSGVTGVVMLLETTDQVPAHRLGVVEWPDLCAQRPDSALVRELSNLDCGALAVRMSIAGSRPRLSLL